LARIVTQTAKKSFSWQVIKGWLNYAAFTSITEKAFMNTIVILHARLTNTVWLFLLFLGLWSLWRAIRGQGLNGNFLGALFISQVLIFVEAGLGGLLYLSGRGGNISDPSIHILYGAFSLVFLPFVFLYWLRGDDTNRAQWVLTFAILFQFGTIFYRFGPYAPI
jgi:hypothetical protein